MNVAAIILAAGNATRFEDGQKLLANIAGRPVIRHVVDALERSSVGDIILVTGRDAAKIADAAGPGRWRAIANPDAGKGLSSSLRLGIQAIGDKADGALVALGDMPGIKTPLVNALLDIFAKDKCRTIVFPMASDNRPGHPVIWPGGLFPALEALSGDSGGRQILSDHRDLWQAVPCGDRGAFTDIDTRQDLDAFRCREF